VAIQSIEGKEDSLWAELGPTGYHFSINLARKSYQGLTPTHSQQIAIFVTKGRRWTPYQTLSKDLLSTDRKLIILMTHLG
jgi:hypothetical protein